MIEFEAGNKKMAYEICLQRTNIILSHYKHSENTFKYAGSLPYII